MWVRVTFSSKVDNNEVDEVDLVFPQEVRGTVV